MSGRVGVCVRRSVGFNLFLFFVTFLLRPLCAPLISIFFTLCFSNFKLQSTGTCIPQMYIVILPID